MNQIQYPNALMWMVPFVPHQSNPLMASLAPFALKPPIDTVPVITEEPEVLPDMPMVYTSDIEDIPNGIQNGETTVDTFGICGTVNTRVVSTDYECGADDDYVGVHSSGTTKITLPSRPKDGKVIIIKAEMPNLANKKVTVTCDDGSLIDGSPRYSLTKAYGVVQLIHRGGDWHVF